MQIGQKVKAVRAANDMQVNLINKLGTISAQEKLTGCYIVKYPDGTTSAFSEWQLRHLCQHILDEGEEGEIFCNEPADNKCLDCQEYYCDEHYNEFMLLCDADSEVEAAKYI